MKMESLIKKKLNAKSERRWKVFLKNGKSHILKMESPLRPSSQRPFFFFFKVTSCK
jgi:hypothetical protein